MISFFNTHTTHGQSGILFLPEVLLTHLLALNISIFLKTLSRFLFVSIAWHSNGFQDSHFPHNACWVRKALISPLPSLLMSWASPNDLWGKGFDDGPVLAYPIDHSCTGQKWFGSIITRLAMRIQLPRNPHLPLVSRGAVLLNQNGGHCQGSVGKRFHYLWFVFYGYVSQGLILSPSVSLSLSCFLDGGFNFF